MKDFDKIAFLSTLSEEVLDYRASERMLAEAFLYKLDRFLNPLKRQVLYRELGEIKLTEHMYTSKAEFLKNYMDVEFIRMLDDV